LQRKGQRRAGRCIRKAEDKMKTRKPIIRSLWTVCTVSLGLLAAKLVEKAAGCIDLWDGWGMERWCY
jgi:hypothetical protein